MDFQLLAGRIVSALARLGRCGVSGLVPIESAQVSGVSYANIGEPGLEFLEDWARSGARVCVPAYANPAGMDVSRWKELGISEQFARKQMRVIAALEKMRVVPTLTCAPYEGGIAPRLGGHVAWSESSAVSYANSVLGARTNREGGPSALAAAICGRTPMTGYHLDENRAPTHVVRVRCDLKAVADYGALGLLVGAQVEDGAPYFFMPDERRALRHEGLKALAAAMAASGAVALFHIHGETPEAELASRATTGLPEIVIDDLSDGYRMGRSSCRGLDVVAIGCPHASLDEIQRVVALLRGRRVKTALWVTTSRYVAAQAAESGLRDEIERSGGKLLSDMCLLVAPLAEMGISAVATDSAKTAYYLRSREDVSVCFDSTDKCVEAAVTGQWANGDETASPIPRRRTGSTARPRPSGLSGCAIVEGRARGEALCSSEPIGFFGHVNPVTGLITERGHELYGQSVAGRILVFPRAKGSTVGSYILYALKKTGHAPLAIIVQEMEPIVAAGAVMADIPAVDGVDTSLIRTGQTIEVVGGEVKLV